MLRQIFVPDVLLVQDHLRRLDQGAGPRVLAQIAGWPGMFQVYAIREVAPADPSEEPSWQQDRLFPLAPPPRKKVEVQIRKVGDQDWHVAQRLFLEEIEEESN